jgi:hypothetical protein
MMGWNATDQSILGHVLCHDGTSGYETVLSKFYSAYDSCISPDRGAATHYSALIFMLSHHMAARVYDVCEDHTGPTENVVFEGYGIIYGNVVLNLDVVSDINIVADKDILSKRAGTADDGLRADMGKMPNLGVLAD